MKENFILMKRRRELKNVNREEFTNTKEIKRGMELNEKCKEIERLQKQHGTFNLHKNV